MKKILTLLVFLGVAIPACADFTHIHDVLYRSDDTTCQGSISLVSPTFTSVGGRLIFANQISSNIVDGVVDLEIEPGQYTVGYQVGPSGCIPTTEYWLVPETMATLTINDVRTLTPPASPTLIPLQWLTQSGATVGQCAAWDGTYWVPATACGNSGAVLFGDILTGTNTSATMTVGAGSSVVYTSTGIINANQILGTTLTSISGVVKMASGIPSAAVAADVVSLFSTCSGVQYLGADGACHNSASGSGTVTSIATTSPLGGGTITSTGTLTCSTCVTGGSLTSGQLILGGGSQGVAVGDLSGDATTSGAATVTVAKVNGVAYGTSPSTNTVPVVTGSNTITYEAVPNAALANAATTVNSQTCTLGSTCTVTAAPSGSAGGDLSGTYPNPAVAKVNGIAYSSTAAAHSVQVTTTANTTVTAKVVPDCTDTGGNHLNFTQGTDAFSCGTSGGGGTSAKSIYYPAAVGDATASDTLSVRSTWSGGTAVTHDSISGSGWNIPILSFANGGASAYIVWSIPSTWDGNSPTFNINFTVPDANAGTVTWTPTEMCYSAGIAGSGGTPTAGSAVNTVVGTAHGQYQALLTVPTTGCVAGDILYLQLTRSAGDSYGSTIYAYGGTLKSTF